MAFSSIQKRHCFKFICTVSVAKCVFGLKILNYQKMSEFLLLLCGKMPSELVRWHLIEHFFLSSTKAISTFTSQAWTWLCWMIATSRQHGLHNLWICHSLWLFLSFLSRSCVKNGLKFDILFFSSRILHICLMASVWELHLTIISFNARASCFYIHINVIFATNN